MRVCHGYMLGLLVWLPDLPYYKRIGVKGVYTQYGSNWGTLTLPYYVPSRLLWDCEADVDRLLGEFYEKFYGPAAGPMRRYYERLEQAAIDSRLHFSPPYYRFPEVFTGQCLADCRECLNEAARLADSDVVRARLAIAKTSLDYTGLVMDYVNAVRAVDEKTSGLRWRLDLTADVFAEASERAALVRKFMARPETTNVIRRGTSYVDRLLNPATTFQDRWDRTDPRQLELKKTVALTRRAWLGRSAGGPLGEVPKTFDLWVYGYDFDAAGEQPEHDLYLLDGEGNRVATLGLPPSGQASNRATGCVVYRDLPWPKGQRDALRLEIVNRPGKWSSSTLLAVYVMPGGCGVSRAKATEMIRSHPDWPRDNSIGFVEFGFNGLVNDETEPTPVDVELLGPPPQIAPLP